MSNPIQQFSDILSGPLGELIASIGRGVGEAQSALDEGSLQQTLALYTIDEQAEASAATDTTTDAETAVGNDNQRLLELIRSIGYQPTFYVIPETEVEAKVSLNMDLSNSQSLPLSTSYKTAKYRANVTPLNANNVNQYNLNANAAATLKFKIVPVPAPSGVAEKRIMPDLVGRPYDDATRGLMASVGLNHTLDDASNTLLEANPSTILTITDQNIVAHTIIEVDTIIELSLQLPELD
ncbi:hypothetical protein JAO71_03830 [Olleya sp. YSTF-M6]|uniref:PASTA domain-containing protein n=1 Tax=Olleya sediminilitoris TaxID=2795739 RepID=A0ABS1WIH4_9FLAO|nr:hypothetical protein [Olleya sediminilitoris]MBL7558925.1 hypothetical protein [Olleya sediminilitoris]